MCAPKMYAKRKQLGAGLLGTTLAAWPNSCTSTWSLTQDETKFVHRSHQTGGRLDGSSDLGDVRLDLEERFFTGSQARTSAGRSARS
jgi:hypothetical protein